MPKLDPALIPIEVIENKIFILWGHRVMLDRDLAELNGVPVKRLSEQVSNSDRFPGDFMFQLTLEEGRRSSFQGRKLRP